MDAYSSYIMNMSNARTSELRREAAEYALSRAATKHRGSWWARVLDRLPRERTPVLTPAATIALRARAADTEPVVELRRSA